jgi:hypothetical protein
MICPGLRIAWKKSTTLKFLASQFFFNLLNRDFKFTQISRAVEVFKEGKFLIVLDNENRENEGDLIIAAGAMNSDKMAFMINNTRFLP